MVQKFGEKIMRLGTVLYWLSIIISFLIAGLIFNETINYNAEWIDYTKPHSYLVFGLTLIVSLFILEIVRRILTYIGNGKSVFEKELPYGVKYYSYILTIPLLVSGILFLINPNLEKIHERQVSLQYKLSFEAFLDNYPERLSEARKCFEEDKETQYQSLKTYCDANYRRVKLNYDSCREYGSRTMCLSYNDYESIDCSKENLLKNAYIGNNCNLYNIDVNLMMKNYLSNNKFLTSEEKTDVLRKIVGTIYLAPDSKLAEILSKEIEKGSFKEEITIISKSSKK